MISTTTGNAQRPLLQAARLRGILAASGYLANPDSERPTPTLAQTELAYQVASLTARPGDRHINREFVADGRLMSPSEIPDDMWSIYDSQLTVYLAPSPRILDAINQFGDVYADMVSG